MLLLCIIRLHETKKKLADVDAALSRASEEVKALERDDIEGVTRLKNLLEETYQKTREKRQALMLHSLWLPPFHVCILMAFAG